MKKDFIIVLAWPEGMVTAAGAWYDRILSKKGKYRVGHSALALVESNSGKVKYFDFGRYHTPKGYGRVRDCETDPDVFVIDPIVEEQTILNIEDILLYLFNMRSTHAKGKLYASVLKDVNFSLAYSEAKKIQNKNMIPYGPFVFGGTNCSRFVADIIRSSLPSFIKRLRFRYPFCISPSPKRNVSITNNNYYIVSKNTCFSIKKSKFNAYFTSIEKNDAT